jgi:hypothetical protein
MDGDTSGNAFANSLQQLVQFLNQQNRGTGSGMSLGATDQGGGLSLGGNQQPSKVITQVHYPTATPQTQSSTNTGQPAVSTPPAQPQVSTFSPPQGGAQAIPQPGGASVPQQGGGGGGGGGGAGRGMGGGADLRNTPYDPDPDIPALQASGIDTSGMGGMAGGAGSGQPTSNAISGITSALSKGLTDAASAIGSVKTMPTPVQSGPFPSINQFAPTLIGRRTQPAY